MLNSWFCSNYRRSIWLHIPSLWTYSSLPLIQSIIHQSMQNLWSCALLYGYTYNTSVYNICQYFICWCHICSLCTATPVQIWDLNPNTAQPLSLYSLIIRAIPLGGLYKRVRDSVCCLSVIIVWTNEKPGETRRTNMSAMVWYCVFAPWKTFLIPR